MTVEDQARMSAIADLRRRAASSELVDFLFWVVVKPLGWSEPGPGPIRHRAKSRAWWRRGLR